MQHRTCFVPSTTVVDSGFVFILLTALSGVFANDETVNFAKQVLPILSNKCFVCHGPDANEDTVLRLDSFGEASKDLGGYRAVDPENPGESELLNRIHSAEDSMPPKDVRKQLTDQEKKILEQWIQQGGKYSRHWAYVAPQKSRPKSNPDASGPAVIDAFLLDQLVPRGFKQQALANATDLARRVSLTLTGLPPEPVLLRSFLSDKSENAYEKLVDQLLANQRYGEHQARYWLDAVRYGDTHGLHLDNRRGIYPYRDWVIKSFNENLAFDKFITWQLAGDLLPDPTLEQLVATGFVRMNPSTAEGGAIPAEFQAKNNFDRTENLGTVFLGMSLTCARCHTHKYDPIPQTEYYRLMAFFNSTAEPSMDGNAYQYGPTIMAPSDLDGWRRWEEHQQGLREILGKAEAVLDAADVVAAEVQGKWKKATRRKKLELIAEPVNVFKDSVLVAQAKKLLRSVAELEKGYTTSLVAKELSKPRETRVLTRGEYNLPIGNPLQPGVISIVNPFPRGVAKNRLGLSMWLLDKKNPLTSRVLINRVWQRVFGYGLVRTPEDFGLQGEQPTHPELLDWLAVEFRENGWNLKKILKLIVMSRAFRQSSSWQAEVDDPENRLFARGPSFRLDAEVLRDIALWGSGLMMVGKGGEGIKPYQPSGMWKALAHPGSNTKNYVVDKGPKLYRRSIYVYWKRTSPHPMMTLFDAPSRETSCVRRSRTNTSLQSLGLLNEIQRVELSRKMAERLIEERSSDEDRLGWLYEMLISRPPATQEKSTCLKLLAEMKQRFKNDVKSAQDLLAVGQAKSREGLNPVEIAAWTQVVVTVLASDAAILMY